MQYVKSVTGELERQNSEEKPGTVTVLNDLQKKLKPSSDNNYIEVESIFDIPKDNIPWSSIQEQYLNYNL